MIGMITELGLDRPVLGGYDIGSRVAQTVAATGPTWCAALVVSPPLPGIGDRILDPRAQQQFWYQSFHQLDLAEQLVDGRRTPCGPTCATSGPTGRDRTTR
jgi:pimeloyl-ACP methyl ester carboxylesterase